MFECIFTPRNNNPKFFFETGNIRGITKEEAGIIKCENCGSSTLFNCGNITVIGTGDNSNNKERRSVITAVICENCQEKNEGKNTTRDDK